MTKRLMGGKKLKLTDTENKYALIGAGPAGLSGAKNLITLNIPFDGFEAHSDVGGLWDIDNPRSTVYESAHLISSKKMTEFRDYPMPETTSDFPSHKELKRYFRNFAKAFGIYEHYNFNVRVEKVEMVDDEHWNISLSTGETYKYKGVIIANGTLSEPNIPKFEGKFDGEIVHSSQYKTASIFEGKRVLIVGAGNSGCDIAVDAVHRADKVDMSLRRGYHFVPKYVFGKPADTVGGLIQLPSKMKRFVDTKLLKIFTGDPVRLGFPKPDHKLYESHPIVNSLILYHVGHGDVSVKKDIKRLEGKTVHFVDGTSEEYDMILTATGYILHYPFIDHRHLNWRNARPALYLNIFHPQYNNLFVLGMIEALGIGWQGRDEQAELMAQFLLHKDKGSPKARKFIEMKREPFPDMSGGYKYIKLDRMAFYVHKETYRNKVRSDIAFFKGEE